MKKNKIIISIFASVCVISSIVGYSLLKQDSHEYDELAVMVKQDDGTYIRSTMSAFGNDDYEFDHAVCNNGTTVTANPNGGVNLTFLGTDKCTVYLRKNKTVPERIIESAKTTIPDFTQVAPKYIPGENFIVNHIYDGYTNIVHNLDSYTHKFTYNEATKQWESPTESNSMASMTLNITEKKENMAICYDSGFNNSGVILFYKNSGNFYGENKSGESCIKIGDVTTEDSLGFEFYAGENDPTLHKFNFYLVDDYTINDTESGIYTMEDDYGTSYYFRGDVDNNYVKFGNFYWRIVRINGDGTLRIAYDGTAPHANGESSTDRALSRIAFNTSYNSNAYVGYMYGNPSGTTYDEVHANINNSTIKKYLDSWYEKNIRDKGLAGYVSDTLFCNDRSVTSGTGVGTTKTNCGAYTRGRNKTDPILTCPQKNDAFTVDDTVKGNGALTYPIGLLTADEYRLAGGKWGVTTFSTKGYLYKPGVIWWLGSPNGYNGGAGEIVVSYGDLNDNSAVSNTYYGVPVINLSAEAANQLRGSGTMNDPYTLE